jgi:hypothetical protein
MSSAAGNKSGHESGPTHKIESCTRLSSWTRRGFVQAGTFLGSCLMFPLNGWGDSRRARETIARGTVFENRDGSGRPSLENPGIPHVGVSNGETIVLTDVQGRWELPVDDQVDSIFVIKPRGWMVPLNDQGLPQATYLHAPEGSPKLRYAGIEATGPLPASIDFGLSRQEEPDQFKAIFCGDPQPRDAREVDYIARSFIPQVRNTEAAFGVSLGDIMFDNLSLYPRLNQTMGLLNRPVYNVLGNHDLNFDARDNRHAYDTFKRTYGATYYSFDWGPVHFLVLNNVEWTGVDPDRPGSRGGYRGFLGQRQLNFIKNDLALVPPDKLVVLAMHIPLINGIVQSPGVETVDREELFRLLENRPHLLSLSAHMHWHANLFLGPDQGFQGARPLHHIVAGTLCGSWFTGAPDLEGIPHAMMADGNPRGYLEVEFDGNQYKIDGYRAIGYPADYQIQIGCPIEVAQAELGDRLVYANVLDGSEHSKVRFRIGEADNWREMEKVWEENPMQQALFERDARLELPYRPLSKGTICQHLWRIPLPADTPVGIHRVEIESTDMYGHLHRGSTTVRVTG